MLALLPVLSSSSTTRAFLSTFRHNFSTRSAYVTMEQRAEQREERKRKERGAHRAKAAGGGPGAAAEMVRISKYLSYLLRHGAEKEGLAMRADGFARVEDILSRPRFHNVDFLQLETIARTDDKQRYTLRFEPLSVAAVEKLNEAFSGSTGEGAAVTAPGERSGQSHSQSQSSDAAAGSWWIRANQGHSLKEVEVDVTPITDPSSFPVVMHGTDPLAWEKIKKTGLSRMNRNHIHFAQGIPGTQGVISGARKNASILIYIDLPRAMEAGYKFFVSSNGVVLCPGDERGFLPITFFRRVETAFKGLPLPGWEMEKVHSKGETRIEKERTGEAQLEIWDGSVMKLQEQLNHRPTALLNKRIPRADPVEGLVKFGSVRGYRYPPDDVLIWERNRRNNG